MMAAAVSPTVVPAKDVQSRDTMPTRARPSRPVPKPRPVQSAGAIRRYHESVAKAARATVVR